MTSVPSIKFEQGFPVAPSMSDIRAGVFADINSAFGGGLIDEDGRPQTELANCLAEVVHQKNVEIVTLAESLKPKSAQGRMQDGLARIYYLDRFAGVGTVVTAKCTGLPGTIIPAGATARSTTGHIYKATGATAIESNGIALVSFQNTTTGPIPCHAGSLSTIMTSIFGWESITNDVAGSVGSIQESSTAFEYRRQKCVRIGGINSLGSIEAAIHTLPNVIDAAIIENRQPTQIDYGASNFTMPAHSILVSVAGGNDEDIAQAIWNKAPPGITLIGNKSHSVKDECNGDVFNTYQIHWLQPKTKRTLISIHIQSHDVALDAEGIKVAVYNRFTGIDGFGKARINSRFEAGTLLDSIYRMHAYGVVASVKIGFSSAAINLVTAFYGIDELPALDESDIFISIATNQSTT